MPPQIQMVNIVAPGRFGLNSENEGALLRPQWLTQANNAVLSRTGRISARKGWLQLTTGAIASNPAIQTLYELRYSDGTTEIITCANNKIFKGIDDYTDSGNDITPSGGDAAPTANHWQFISTGDSGIPMIGVQRDHDPIVWSGSGDCLVQEGVAFGNAILSAFGRTWVAGSDLQSIYYSGLLLPFTFSEGSGGGSIDMTSVWTRGIDEIVAIAAIGSTLVVFGKRHIIMWADGSGSEVGLDPAQIEVVDTIEGTGCIARDSVQPTSEGDLLFLSRVGIQSLGRVIQSKSNPLVVVSKHVRQDLIDVIEEARETDAELDKVRATYSAELGLYILNFPEQGEMFVLDVQHPFPDDEGETAFPMTRWQMSGNIHAVTTISDGRTLLGSNGIVGKYYGYDDDGEPYDFEILSGWLDFGDLNHRLKILKEITASVNLSNEADLTWRWEFDFNGTELTRVVSYSGSGEGAEFGEAEFGEGEFGSFTTIERRNFPAHGEGQFIRVGVSCEIDGQSVVLQQMTVAPKIGRAAT